MLGSSSKVIMGATLVMAVSLAIVVGLVFVLLAELYCSILLRRRRKLQASAGAANTANADGSSAAQLSSFYSQGVLSAPRSLLFPAKEDQQESKTSPRQLGILSPPNSYVTTSPQPAHVQSTGANPPPPPELLVYISNPIYDGGSRGGTPFETPDTSPSRFESGDEENQITPPLSPMKKLPPEACSVSLALRDATSLGTSASGSNGHSSSSSGSPRTSPSW